MNKQFCDRIKYFKNNRRLLILSLEALLGKKDTKELMKIYNNTTSLSIKESNDFSMKAIEKGGYSVSALGYKVGVGSFPTEYTSNVEYLLQKIYSTDKNIEKLRNGEWVDIQEDYEEPTMNKDEIIRNVRNKDEISYTES